MSVPFFSVNNSLFSNTSAVHASDQHNEHMYTPFGTATLQNATFRAIPTHHATITIIDQNFVHR